MADIVNDTDLDTSWGDAINIPERTRKVEIWGVDDVTSEPPTRVALWALIEDGSDAAPIYISSTSTYSLEFSNPNAVQQGQWTIKLLAPGGTHDGVVVFT